MFSPQSHASSWSPPTANLRHSSASVAVVRPLPSASQMHDGSQSWPPTAALSRNKQSDAVGLAPLLSGWAQSPCAAFATPAPRMRNAPKLKAAPAKILRLPI